MENRPKVSDLIDNNKLFTKRETEVVFLVLKGMSNKDIAHKLGCSHRTIESHISNIYKKSDCLSRDDFIKYMKKDVPQYNDFIDPRKK